MQDMRWDLVPKEGYDYIHFKVFGLEQTYINVCHLKVYTQTLAIRINDTPFHTLQ